jgi:hypothetical protein
MSAPSLDRSARKQKQFSLYAIFLLAWVIQGKLAIWTLKEGYQLFCGPLPRFVSAIKGSLLCSPAWRYFLLPLVLLHRWVIGDSGSRSLLFLDLFCSPIRVACLLLRGSTLRVLPCHSGLLFTGPVSSAKVARSSLRVVFLCSIRSHVIRL